MRARLGAAALLLLGAAAGCPPATPTPPAQEPATAAPVPSAAEAPASDPADWADPNGGLPPLLDHPEGVPFPLPDPLPPEARPRSPAGFPPEVGPAPVDLILGGPGEEDGRLLHPRAVIAWPDGSFAAVDKAGRIHRWDANGRLMAVVRTPAIKQGKPTGLGLDGEGGLLAADTHYSRILFYGPDLALGRVWGAPGRDPGRFMFISACKVGPDGLIWTCDYGDDVARVQAFQKDGTHVRAFGTFGTEVGELRRPMSLCFVGEELFVADAVNHRIAVFDRQGAWRRALGGPGTDRGQMDFPYDVVADERGRLWVAEFGGQRLQVLDPQDGRCLGLWGEPGRRPGTLGRPWGVALGPALDGAGDHGRVWLLDSLNDRIYGLDRAAVLANAPPPGGSGQR